MPKAKSKSETQIKIDELWRRYNNLMDDAEELAGDLQEMEDERPDLDFSKALSVVGVVHSNMSDAFSTGRRILPPHSSDGGDAKDE
jgi:hypothetical protein